jgi:hypothetical protein
VDPDPNPDWKSGQNIPQKRKKKYKKFMIEDLFVELVASPVAGTFFF